MQIPISLKIRNLSEVVRLDENEPGPKGTRYFQKTNEGKLLLRRMIMNYIPSEISNSAKQGFSDQMRLGSKERVSSMYLEL